MTFAVQEFVARSERHTSFYLAAGAAEAVPMIFVHGWPELSISWRHQLPVFAALGLRAVAPDMRGYGRSSVYPRHEDYAIEHSVADMIALLDALGAEKAIWVGHDWGSPVVWALAQHHPERCHGVANLCLPYIPEGFAIETILPHANRALYPEDQYPAAQWDYHLFYRDNFAAACGAFDADPRAFVKLVYRRADAANRGQQAVTAAIRAQGGWFGPGASAPDLPRDARVLSEEDENRYTEALIRNGFFGPDSWYMNGDANAAFAARANDHWRLEMPVLFLHALYDNVCETVDSRLAGPMREWCPDLSETVVASGHWMAQEQPAAVNAALAKWLAAKFPALWPAPEPAL